MASGLTPTVRAFLAQQQAGVLGTTRPDGSVRQSVVYHVLEDDRVLISTESKRAKAGDVQRTGRASYCVLGPEKPFPSVTVEGPARIVTEGVGEPTTRIFEVISGTAPAEPLEDEDLAAVDRVILELTIERVYGASYLEGG
ncbi:MAG: TIGR03618 family F420-dependent PPOX class oxidoreductase [Actinomycetota bacterium]